METIKGFGNFIADIIKDRKILWGLAINDFKSKFASSFAGSFWAFFQPLMTLLVMWFVFQVGFKNPPVNDVPFIVWLAPPYLVWAFFSEALMSGTSCMIEYSYLVKKVNFRVSIIPLVKIISSLFVHLGFIVFIFVMMVVNGVSFSLYNIQIIYYCFCAVCLLIGMNWMLSALAPFVKDVVNIVGVFIQIGFWAIPIFWNPSILSKGVRYFLKLNPMYYVCTGYRDCIVDRVWIWDRGIYNLYFWLVVVFFFVVGAFLFKKMRPQFADVL